MSWPGRTNEYLTWSGVECRLSAAHNEESIAHDFAQISEEEHVLVIGMTQKGDLSSSIEPLRHSASRVHTIVTRVDGGRNPTESVEDIASEFLDDDSVEVIRDNFDAMDGAARIASANGCMVYVTGSVYLVGSIFAESIIRDQSDLWESLAVHPPR